jgi:hypothetical protein
LGYGWEILLVRRVTKIDLGVQLPNTDSEELEINYILPNRYKTWCKGKINNGKLH